MAELSHHGVDVGVFGDRGENLILIPLHDIRLIPLTCNTTFTLVEGLLEDGRLGPLEEACVHCGLVVLELGQHLSPSGCLIDLPSSPLCIFDTGELIERRPEASEGFG